MNEMPMPHDVETPVIDSVEPETMLENQDEVQALMKELYKEYLKVAKCQRLGIRHKDKSVLIQKKIMKLTQNQRVQA